MSDTIDWVSFHQGNDSLPGLDKVRIAKRYFDNLHLLGPGSNQIFNLIRAIKKTPDDIKEDFISEVFKDTYGYKLSLPDAMRVCISLYEKAILVKDFDLPNYEHDSLAVSLSCVINKSIVKITSKDDYYFAIIKYICYNLYTARVDWCIPYMGE